MAQTIHSVRGTRDLLPPDTALWNFVEAALRDVFRLYNFHEIRTPIIEDLALFQRSVGEETDIVGKELFVLRTSDRVKRISLESLWVTKHASEGDLLEPDRLPQMAYRPDYKIVFRDLGIALIEIKATGLKPETIESLYLYTNGFQEMDPAGNRPRAVLVVPTGSIPSRLRELALKRNIEVEEITSLEGENEEDIALRPENTAGVVRAYIENKLWERPGLQKLFYIGPQFRRERPQKGRYRQFYQIGAEVIGPAAAGSESATVDAEILELLATLLDRVGISGWQLQLNSVGCENDRPRYNQALRDSLAGVIDKMCSDCQRRVTTNPLRVLDCKVPADQPIIEKLPKILDYLDDSCRAHFAKVRELLEAVSIPYTVNPRLARGIDYYKRTAFEFTHGALGAQNAILGGGRYDGLSEALGGPPAPGIGFAIGEDRFVMALEKDAQNISKPVDVYIAPLGEGMDKEAARLARELRRHDVSCELGNEMFRLKKSLETASKIGARYALIVGENEVKSGAFALKNLGTGEQITVRRKDLPQKIRT